MNENTASGTGTSTGTGTGRNGEGMACARGRTEEMTDHLRAAKDAAADAARGADLGAIAVFGFTGTR